MIRKCRADCDARWVPASEQPYLKLKQRRGRSAHLNRCEDVYDTFSYFTGDRANLSGGPLSQTSSKLPGAWVRGGQRLTFDQEKKFLQKLEKIAENITKAQKEDMDKLLATVVVADRVTSRLMKLVMMMQRQQLHHHQQQTPPQLRPQPHLAQ